MIIEFKFVFFILFILSTLSVIIVGMATNIIATDVWQHKTFTNPNTSIWSKYVMPASLISFLLMWVSAIYQWSVQLY